MTGSADAVDVPGRALLDLYDVALPQVHGYLLRRCGVRELAEDLTADTFVAAVDAVRRGTVRELGVPWLLGVARHKLADHWRRRAREERLLVLLDGDEDLTDDDWDTRLDAHLAHEVLDALATAHRAALVLRHLDGLPVPQVAALLGRTTGATEVLLVRARRAFRAAYEARTDGGEDR